MADWDDDDILVPGQEGVAPPPQPQRQPPPGAAKTSPAPVSTATAAAKVLPPREKDVAAADDAAESHFEKMFSLLDASGGGRIHLAAVHSFNDTLPESIRVPESQLTEMFNSYDVDRSNDIDIEEFHGLCEKISSVTRLSVEQMAEYFHRKQLQRLFDLIDESGFRDQSISKYELQTFLETVKESPEVKHSSLGLRIRQMDVGHLIAQEVLRSEDGKLSDTSNDASLAAAGASSATTTSAVLASASLNFAQFCNVIDKIISGTSISVVIAVFAEAALRRKQRRTRAISMFKAGAQDVATMATTLEQLKSSRPAQQQQPRTPTAQDTSTPSGTERRGETTGEGEEVTKLRDRVAELEAQLRDANTQFEEIAAEAAAARHDEAAANGALTGAKDEIGLLRQKLDEEVARRTANEQNALAAGGELAALHRTVEELRATLKETESGRNLLKVRVGTLQRGLDVERHTCGELRAAIGNLQRDIDAVRQERDELKEKVNAAAMAAAMGSAHEGRLGASNGDGDANSDADESDEVAFEEFAFSSGITFKLPVIDDSWWATSKETTPPASEGRQGDREAPTPLPPQTAAAVVKRIVDIRDELRDGEKSLDASTSAPPLASSDESRGPRHSAALAELGAGLQLSLLPAVTSAADRSIASAEKLQRCVERLALPCQIMVQLHEAALADLRSLAALPVLTRLRDLDDDNDHDGRDRQRAQSIIELTDDASQLKESLEKFLENMRGKRDANAPRRDICADTILSDVAPAQRGLLQAVTSVVNLLNTASLVAPASQAPSTMEVLPDDDGGTDVAAAASAPQAGTIKELKARVLKALHEANSSMVDVLQVAQLLASSTAPLGGEAASLSWLAQSLNVPTEKLRELSPDLSDATLGVFLVEALALLVVTAMEGTADAPPCAALPNSTAKFLLEPRRKAAAGDSETPTGGSLLDDAEQQLQGFASALEAVAQGDRQSELFTSVGTAMSALSAAVDECAQQLRNAAPQSPSELPAGHAQSFSSRATSPIQELQDVVGSLCSPRKAAQSVSMCDRYTQSPLLLTASFAAQHDTATHEAAIGTEVDASSKALTADVDASVTDDDLDAAEFGLLGDDAASIWRGLSRYVTATERRMVAERLRAAAARNANDNEAMSGTELRNLMHSLVAEITGRPLPHDAQDGASGQRTSQLSILSSAQAVSIDESSADFLGFIRAQAALRSRLDGLTAELASMNSALSAARDREETLMQMNATYSATINAQKGEVVALRSAQALMAAEADGMAQKLFLMEQHIARLERDNFRLSLGK